MVRKNHLLSKPPRLTVAAALAVFVAGGLFGGGRACGADQSEQGKPGQAPQLRSQQASMDKATGDNQSIESGTSPTKQTLNGRVEHAKTLEGQSEGGAHNPAAPPESALNENANGNLTLDLDAAQAADIRDLMRAFTSSNFLKLMINGKPASVFNLKSRKPKLSAEEIRKMEYGVTGMDCISHLDDAGGPTITAVYPTCPAALAGILPGDLLVEANGHVFKRGEGQRVLWKVVAGKAGTPVDITVLREGKLLTFHLTRMNIEDIEDVKIRRTYENLMETIGPPTAGQATD